MNPLNPKPSSGVAAVAAGLTTQPFAYEAAALALPMALSAAWFYRRPTMVGARRMFYGSLLYLPAFQGLCCFHRVPREHGAEATVTTRWQIEWEGLDRLGALLEETSQAPFPFLPVPFWPDRCPHKAECEGSDEGEGADESEDEDENEGVGKGLVRVKKSPSVASDLVSSSSPGEVVVGDAKARRRR